MSSEIRSIPPLADDRRGQRRAFVGGEASFARAQHQAIGIVQP